MTEGLDKNKNYHFADLTFGSGGHSISLANLSKNYTIHSCD